MEPALIAPNIPNHIENGHGQDSDGEFFALTNVIRTKLSSRVETARTALQNITGLAKINAHVIKPLVNTIKLKCKTVGAKIALTTQDHMQTIKE